MYVVDLVPRLFQNFAAMADNYGVCRNDEGRLSFLYVVDLSSVNIAGLFRGRPQDVFEGREGLAKILGEIRGDDVEFGESKL